MEIKRTMDVYVANLGKYNEGELVGTWITLPKTDEELDRILTDEVGLELDAEKAFLAGQRGEDVYEEYAIHDFEYDGLIRGLGLHIGEYTSLRALNDIAWIANNPEISDEVIKAIKVYSREIDTLYAYQVANLLVNYEYLDFLVIPSATSTSSLEEDFGWYMLELNPELEKVLEDHDIIDYFNVEEYGRSQAMDGYLHAGIYIDGRSNMYEHMEDYDEAEIHEYAKEVYDQLISEQTHQASSLTPEQDRERAYQSAKDFLNEHVSVVSATGPVR